MRMGNHFVFLSFDVRNSCQLECTFIHDRLVDRLKAVVRIVLTISLCNIRARVFRVWPVSSAYPALKCTLLLHQVFLCG
jgi:hypothetical protein